MSIPAPFCYPTHDISNDRIKLTPFIPSIHAKPFYQKSSPHPSLYAYIPTGPYPNLPTFLHELTTKILPPTSTSQHALAIIDKTRPPSSTSSSSGISEPDPEGSLAGITCYLNTSPKNRSTEIGFILVFPQFQRTHVTSNTVGLMLRHALEPPSLTSSAEEKKGGLGLLRVEWYANSANTGSIRVAERMGFSREALLRWHSRLEGGEAEGKIGHGRPLPPGAREGEVWRDSLIFSVTWEDWRDGVRDRVEAIMNRDA